MVKEKWDEICFLLSENISPEISEHNFEQNVIQALRVLDWKEYSGDVEIRPSFQIGAANRISPDFVIKSTDGTKLFVIEIKQPNIPLTTTFQQQLFSYMRQLKLEYGILIGQGIQIFYDGSLSKQEDPILLETIKFTRENDKGLKFVELFAKDSFHEETLKSFTLKSLQKINQREESKKLREKILTSEYHFRISELIKEDFLNEYDGELIDSVLKDLKIEVKENNPAAVSNKSFFQSNKVYHQNGVLPIELNPKNEADFKRRLLLTKTAYITTFYKDGSKKEKVWNVNRLKESSNLIGNLRSRPEFRNGEWQKRKIEKVYVSIDMQT